MRLMTISPAAVHVLAALLALGACASRQAPQPPATKSDEMVEPEVEPADVPQAEPLDPVAPRIVDLGRSKGDNERILEGVGPVRLVGLTSNEVRTRAARYVARVRALQRAAGIQPRPRPRPEPPRRASPLRNIGTVHGWRPPREAPEPGPEGIVRPWGKDLAILQRGRLLTVRLGETPGSATVTGVVDLQRSESNEDVSYHDLHVHERTGTAVVLGQADGADVIGLYRLKHGKIAHRETHALRSNEQSWLDHARIVGDALVLHGSHSLFDFEYSFGDPSTPEVSLPAMRRLGSRAGPWRSIVSSGEVFHIEGDDEEMTLHAIVTCDLSRASLTCRAGGIVGGRAWSSHESEDAVYVRVVPGDRDLQSHLGVSLLRDDEQPGALEPSYVFRLPFDGGRPGAVAVPGLPLDDASFATRDEHLWVLLRPPKSEPRSVALLRVPMAAFVGSAGDASAAVVVRTLPSPTSEALRGPLVALFVGDFVLYGRRTAPDARGGSPLPSAPVFVHHEPTARTHRVDLPGDIHRIAGLGAAALIVASDGEALHLHALGLGETPRLGNPFVRPNGARENSRITRLSFLAQTPATGMLALARHGSLGSTNALDWGDVIYASVSDLEVSLLGILRSHRKRRGRSETYRNTTPLLHGERIFALLGDELVEGLVEHGRMQEAGRTPLHLPSTR
jgi:hypothetical protein